MRKLGVLQINQIAVYFAGGQFVGAYRPSLLKICSAYGPQSALLTTELKSAHIGRLIDCGSQRIVERSSRPDMRITDNTAAGATQGEARLAVAYLRASDSFVLVT